MQEFGSIFFSDRYRGDRYRADASDRRHKSDAAKPSEGLQLSLRQAIAYHLCINRQAALGVPMGFHEPCCDHAQLAYEVARTSQFDIVEASDVCLASITKARSSLPEPLAGTSLKLFVADGFRGHHFMQHDIACLMGIGGYTALYILKDLASLVQTTELEELDLVIQIQSKVPEFRSALRLLNCIPLREILLEEEGFHYQIFYYQLNFNRELFSAWRALPDPTLGRRENPAFREYLEGDQEIEDFFLSKVSRCELAERAKSDRVLREFLELFYERQGRHYYQTSLGRHNLAVHDLDLARVERLHQARLSLGSNLV